MLNQDGSWLNINIYKTYSLGYSLAPGGGEMKDPGNEVEIFPDGKLIGTVFM